MVCLGLPTIHPFDPIPDGLGTAKGQHGSGPLVKSDSGNAMTMSFDLIPRLGILHVFL